MATTILENVNTDVIPVLDFGCYGGMLSWIADDVFDYSSVIEENLSPESMGQQEYDEAMELIAEKYVGYDEFNKQVLEDAPYYIQKAFDDYNIPAKVVEGSCSWWHPREYNFADDCINFDLEINTDWVAKTFMELSKDEDFIEFIKSKYTSRSGFISFMPNSIDGFNEYISPDDHEYWKVVSAIVSYLVDIDPSVKEDVMDEMVEDLRGSGNFVTYSDLNMN